VLNGTSVDGLEVSCMRDRSPYTSAGALLLLSGFFVACSNAQQVYSAARMLPLEINKRVGTADLDANGQKTTIKGELGGSAEEITRSEQQESEFGDGKLSQLYLASKIVSHESSYVMASARVTSKITMASLETPKTLTMNQMSRENVVDVFTQGGNGQTVVEFASQSSAKGALDILIVVDDSASMAGEQKNLSTKLEPLLSEISESDWRIGVITTSKKQTGLRALISRGDAKAAELFKSAVTPGTRGSWTERGIHQAVQGLKAPGFLRTGSSVAVLIVSDEDNCSTGVNSSSCRSEESRFASYLTDYLSKTAQRELKTQARVYGLTWIPGTECKGAYNQGRVYAEAVEISGGRSGSICDPDYTSTLKDISMNVKSILQNSWSLKHTPDQNSLKVFFDDVEVKSGYKVEGNFVTFTQVPAADVKIRFEYNVGAQPILTSFRLSEVPHAEGLSILVNGVDIQDAYSLSQIDPRFLTLNNTAPEFAKITVNYKKASDLPQSFKIDGRVKANSVTVRVDNVEVPHLYDSASALLSLMTPPDEGALISVDYTELGAAILEYPFNSAGDSVSDLAAKDAKSNESVTILHDASRGLIRFQASDFAQGREILLSFNDPRVLDGVYALPHIPIPSSLKVFDGAGSQICEMPGSVAVDSNRLTLTCGIEPGGEFHVQYWSLTEIKNQFKFDLVPLGLCDLMRWEVSINGMDGSNSLERSGCLFSTKGPLAPEAQIAISALPLNQ